MVSFAQKVALLQSQGLSFNDAVSTARGGTASPTVNATAQTQPRPQATIQPVSAAQRSQSIFGHPFALINQQGKRIEQQASIESAQSRVGTLNVASTAVRGYDFLSKSATASKIGGAIDVLGSKVGFADVNANFIGPLQPGQSVGVTASGALTGAGIGYTVGSLFPTDRQNGAEVGGTIGGVVGSVGGPLGSVIGAAIGSSIGSLFGPEPTAASIFNAAIDNTALSNLTFGSKSMSQDFAKASSDSVSALLTDLQTIGVSTSGLRVMGGYNSREQYGAYLQLGRGPGETPQESYGVYRYDATNQQETAERFADLGVAIIERGAITNAAVKAEYSRLKAAGTDNLALLNGLLAVGKQKAVTTPVNAAVAATSNPIVVNESTRAQVQAKVAAAESQFNELIQKTKENKAGRDSTIKTGPRGILEPARVFKRKLIGIETGEDGRRTILGG